MSNFSTNVRPSSKRKNSTTSTSPASPRAKKRWTQDEELEEEDDLWGVETEDLRLVKISVNAPLYATAEALLLYNNVCYTEYKTGKQIEADVKSSEVAALVIENILKTDVNHKLGPLIQQFKPLENLIIYKHGKKGTIQWRWNKNLGKPSMEQLCMDFVRAFRGKMEDTVGKHALKALLEQIIIRLDMRAVVVATGSARGSPYASYIKMEYVIPSPESSASSEAYTPEYVNHNVTDEIEESPSTLRSSIQKASAKPTGPGSSSIGDRGTSPKRCVSDVLVHALQSDYEPLQTYLVVSIKRGVRRNPVVFAQEILGRLPYQTGIIYGLEINQFQADLLSVEKCNDDSGSFVKLNHYPIYHFNDDFNFGFVNFKKMLLDIGSILMLSKDSS